jgi:competence protein ComEA
MRDWFERYRGVLFFSVIVLAIAGVVLFQILRPDPPPIILSTPTPFPSPQAAPTPRPLRVYVSGAVRLPDVYILPADSIVKDAIVAAGGSSGEADLDRINLAMTVADGQHVYVPHLGEENLPVQPPSGRAASEVKLNINTADLSALETLPGIGSVIAQRILDYRQTNGPFARVEDVMAVSGIGPVTFEEIRDLITTK